MSRPQNIPTDSDRLKKKIMVQITAQNLIFNNK